ncbi:MAG: hypothetical protein U5K28_09135 [Halobacteriales archaeon]|nr:hypothetical protein [Halobacteriales archaeon]
MKRSAVAVLVLVILLAAVGTAALVTYSSSDYLAGRELSVELSASDNETVVAVVHDGGDTLDATNTGALQISVTNVTNGNGTVVASRRIETDEDVFPFAAGDTIRLYAPAAEPGMRIEVIWIGPTDGAGQRTFLDTTL